MSKFLYIICILCMINYSYTCTSEDQLRDLMINSCTLFKKLKLSFDFTSCCDQDKIKICARYFCN